MQLSNSSADSDDPMNASKLKFTILNGDSETSNALRNLIFSFVKNWRDRRSYCQTKRATLCTRQQRGKSVRVTFKAALESSRDFDAGGGPPPERNRKIFAFRGLDMT